MKIIILFFIFFISFSYALDFKISPKELNYSGNTNEWLCQNISVQISKESDLEISSKWTQNISSRKISDYNLSNERENINFNYSKNINLYEICFKSKYLVNKKGVLLVKPIDELVGIGIWINFNTVKSKDKIKLIENKYNNKFNFSIFFVLIFCLIIIELLILLKNKKGK